MVGDSAQARKFLRVSDRPFQIFRGAPQQSRPVPEIAEPEVARQAEQAANDVPAGAVIHAKPVTEFLSADRAAALLPLKHRRVLFRRDPVVAFESACKEFVPIARVLRVALALACLNFGFVGRIVGPNGRNNFFPVLRVFRVAFAPALKPLRRGQRPRLALFGGLLGTAPLAPAMFARALAVAGHAVRNPNAETRAAAKRSRTNDCTAAQVGSSRLARATVPILGTAEIGAALQA